LEVARQEIFGRASAEEQVRYLELMRHDPIAGMAYLDALGLMQQERETSKAPVPAPPDCHPDR
jgi:hypothetical protein